MENRWYPAANRDARVEWDFEDRLVRVVKGDGTVVENVYDVDGVLVKSGGVEYLVDTSGGLSHVVAEIDGSGAVTAVYVRADDMLLEEIRGGVAKMYEADGLGSVRGLLDASGSKTDTYSYEAFGATLNTTGNDLSPYRFAGERWIGEVGMYQNRARWLDTRTGRFVSVDPERGVWDEPATMAPYIYARTSPVSYADPTGRFADPALTIMVMAVERAFNQALEASGAFTTTEMSKRRHALDTVMSLHPLPQGWRYLYTVLAPSNTCGEVDPSGQVVKFYPCAFSHGPIYLRAVAIHEVSIHLYAQYIGKNYGTTDQGEAVNECEAYDAMLVLPFDSPMVVAIQNERQFYFSKLNRAYKARVNVKNYELLARDK